MATLTITNEAGTVFEYSKDGEFLVINVTKNGVVNTYKTYSNNAIKDGKLNVCREDGSWVLMPVFDEALVNEFKDGRTLVKLETLEKVRQAENNPKMGAAFSKNGVMHAYLYA